MINDSLCVADLKILIKILELFHVVYIIAPWKKLAMIFSKCDYVSDISAKSKLCCNGLILIKMIDHLTVKQIHIVNIFLFAQVLQVIIQ